MIGKLCKKSSPLIFSLLTLTGCNTKTLENNILEMKQFLKISSHNLEEDLKPVEDDSILSSVHSTLPKSIFQVPTIGKRTYSEKYDDEQDSSFD